MPDGSQLTIFSGFEERNNAGFIYIKVSDTGVGILKDSLLFIFEPFYFTKENRSWNWSRLINNKV